MEIKARLEGLGNLQLRWEVTPSHVKLHLRTEASDQELRVTREADPASPQDVEFVGHAFADVPRLIEALDGHALDADAVAAIDRRIRAASPGPWTPVIESEGGSGGSDVIRVSEDDNEADMYLWVGSDLAPSAVFRFVAEARQDIPALLAAASEP